MNGTSACLLSLTLAWCGPTAMALSVFDVIELTSNGYDETEIERLIEVTNARFVIDVDSLLALGEADVEDEIITLMLERGAEPPEELSEADQLIVLREAGFSEETIMQFVQHKNVCEPLADEDEHRLGQAGFSSAFLRDFGAQVEDCREEQESLALIEPLPEEAYEEAPTQVTRVYRTDATVYPATTTVRYPTTTYYPPRYYGIYDSYYYHDRITRVYPIVVYRDYSGHKHRYRKAGHRYGKDRHRARDHDRRRHDGDRRRGDRRGDRDKGDRDRPRRRDSDVRPRRPHPRSDPNPRLLAGDTPADRVHSTTAPACPETGPEGASTHRKEGGRSPVQPAIRSEYGFPNGSPNGFPTGFGDGLPGGAAPAGAEVARGAGRRSTANRTTAGGTEGAGLDITPSKGFRSHSRENTRASVPAAAADAAVDAATADATGSIAATDTPGIAAAADSAGGAGAANPAGRQGRTRAAVDQERPGRYPREIAWLAATYWRHHRRQDAGCSRIADVRLIAGVV